MINLYGGWVNSKGDVIIRVLGIISEESKLFNSTRHIHAYGLMINLFSFCFRYVVSTINIPNIGKYFCSVIIFLRDKNRIV